MNTWKILFDESLLMNTWKILFDESLLMNTWKILFKKTERRNLCLFMYTQGLHRYNSVLS